MEWSCSLHCPLCQQVVYDCFHEAGLGGGSSVRMRRQTKQDLLLQQLPVGGVCAEIGVWKGDFSAKILDVATPTTLHLIDPWRFEAGDAYREALYGGRLEVGQTEMDSIFSHVVERFATEIQEGTVVIHRGASADVVSEFEDGTLDWVYIDGNHLYEFVRLDLELWSKKVKPGGLLAGDDYREGAWWNGGVKRAVDEFSARHGYEPMLFGRVFILTIN